MDKENATKLVQRLGTLAIFRELLISRAFKAIGAMLLSNEASEQAAASGELLSEMLKHGTNNITEFIESQILYHDNVFSRACARGDDVTKFLATAVSELDVLKELAELKCDDFKEEYPYFLATIAPEWQTGEFSLDVKTLIREYSQKGYGIWRECKAVGWSEKNKEFVPILHASEIKYKDLKLYESEKQAIDKNTRAFIKGLPSLNVLLYGDRGTGKSSTVHAVVNEYARKGLRLVEITKKAICDLSIIYEKLEQLPFKFIIFIDDLTFNDGDEIFSQFKAEIEGSMSSKKNVIVYATSNRRHLIKENVLDRSGNDLHVSDTMQEQMSLADRFGLIITFVKPDKDEFIKILCEILNDRKVKYDYDQVALYAEQYALKKGGRSPRAAKQIADVIESSYKLKHEVEF